jgi:site-specific recombinase XerD
VLKSGDHLFDVSAAVREYIKDMKPNDLLFRNSKGELLTRDWAAWLFEQDCERAGIPEHKTFIHVPKLTAGITLRKSGADIKTIQEVLGHKNINSAAQYLRIGADEADGARPRAFGDGGRKLTTVSGEEMAQACDIACLQ